MAATIGCPHYSTKVYDYNNLSLYFIRVTSLSYWNLKNLE